MNIGDLVKINKDVFIKIASTASKGAVLSAFPYLLGPFAYLINKSLDWIVLKIADGLELASFFVYIDFRVDAQGKAYVESVKKCQEIEKTGTPYQIEEARRIADEKFKIFVKFTT